MTDRNSYPETQGAYTNAASIAIADSATRPSEPEIVEWCRNYVAHTLDVPVETVDPDAEFDALGFDSAAAVALVVEVGTWMNLDLEPAALFDYPTISAFAEYLAKQ
jgi:acyl carrier protein